MSIEFRPLSSTFRKPVVVTWAIFFVLMVAFHWIFSPFFPTKYGTMGHDWHWLPGYLLGYQDFLKNGVPFFSDGKLFTVGMNAASCYAAVSYSFNVPHNPLSLLIWMGLDPIHIGYMTFLIFAAIGFWGMYTLLRNALDVEQSLAILGAGIYLFNGFYAHRIIIGHGYFAVMLVPVIAYLLIKRSRNTGSVTRTDNLLWGVCAGVAAYFAYSFGAMVIVVAVSMGIVSLLLLFLLLGGAWGSVLIRIVVALAIAGGLAANGLLQTVSTPGMETAIAQRVSYSFPAIKGLASTINLLAQMLVVSPANIESIYVENVVNMRIWQGRHELEYGITAVPFVLIIFAGVLWFNQWRRLETAIRLPHISLRYVWFVGLLLLLAFPIIYTTDFPSLLPIIKRVPLINATTSPQRIYYVYVLAIPVIAIVFANRFLGKRYGWFFCLAGLAWIIGSAGLAEREYYHRQPYDPNPIMEAHAMLRQGQMLPPIQRIGVLADKQGNFVHDQMVEANLFLKGIQHMGCYHTGYNGVSPKLLGSLHPGSIWDETDGYLNIENPACNTWPIENNCKLGEHFTVAQRDWVRSYTESGRFPVNVPDKVRYAAYVTALTFFLTFTYLVLNGVIWLRQKFR